MEKRHFNRNRRLTTAAALAIAGTAGLSSIASAALTLQLTTSTGNATMGATSTSIAAGSTAPITLDIWAAVSGTTATQLIQSADFSLYGPAGQGQGTIVGNYSSPALLSLFKASGAQDPTTTPANVQSDLDGDGGLDVGATSQTDATNWMVARAGTPVQASTAGALAFTVGNTLEVKLGTVTFNPSTGVTAGTDQLAIKGRQNPNGALWFQDSTSSAATGPGPAWSNNLSPGTGGGTYVNGSFTINVTGGGPANAVWARDTNTDNGGTGGNWTLSTNWTGGVPGLTNSPAAGDVANFTSVGDSSGTRLVRLDSNETIGGMVFDSAPGSGYSISSVSGQAITLNNGTTGNPTITVTSGNSTISSKVTVGQNMTVAGAGGSVTLSNLDNSAGKTITKSGASTLNLSGTQTHGTNAAIVMNGGTINVSSNLGTDDVGGGETVAKASLTVNAGTINVTSNQSIRGLSFAVDGDGSAIGKVSINYPTDVGASGGDPSAIGLVSALRVYAGGTASGNAPTATQKTDTWHQVVVGSNFGDGSWSGLGITTNQITHPLINGLGMETLTDNNGAKFLAIGEMEIGDVNGDDSVDSGDTLAARQHLNQAGTWSEGDMNYDETVDSGDILTIRQHLNQSFDVSNGPALGGVSAVPEPGSLSLLGLGAAALIGRRRRR